MGWLRFSSCLRLTATWWAYARRDVPKLFAQTEAEPYATTVALLEAFTREALQRGAKFAPVLIFPREDDLLRFAIAHDCYWAGLIAELERRGVTVIDMTPQIAPGFLAAHDDPSLPRMFAGGHLSGAANAIVARALREQVDARFPAGR
jgi:ribosomal protein S12 methylthiotransferase accessory factor YcaO